MLHLTCSNRVGEERERERETERETETERDTEKREKKGDGSFHNPTVGRPPCFGIRDAFVTEAKCPFWERVHKRR